MKIEREIGLKVRAMGDNFLKKNLSSNYFN